MSALLRTDDLYEWTDIRQRAKLIAWLNENSIPYRLDKTGSPITTMDAVNASLLDRKISDEVAF